MAQAPVTTPEIDFSLLSTGLGVLSTSPAWPEVEAALQRLEHDPRSANAADIALVQEYARKLTREADTIGRALVVGAAVGIIAGNDRKTQIVRGLETLSAGYGLRRLGSAEVARMLKGLVSDVVAAHGGIKLSTTYSLRGSRTIAGWLHLVRKDLARVAATGPPKVDTSAAWESWANRLLGYFQTGAAPEPSLVQLIYDAGKTGPGAWLRIDPSAMTVWDWSRIVQGVLGTRRRTSELPPPPWAGVAALRALGLPPVDLSPPAGGKTRKAEAAQTAEGRALGEHFVRTLPVRPLPDLLALVVANPQKPPQDAWIPSPSELATLLVDPADFAAFAGAPAAFFDMLTSPSKQRPYLVVEVDADGAEPPAVTGALRGSFLDRLRRVDMYPESPRTTPQRPFVVAPASPADLVRGLYSPRAQAS